MTAKGTWELMARVVRLLPWPVLVALYVPELSDRGAAYQYGAELRRRRLRDELEAERITVEWNATEVAVP